MAFASLTSLDVARSFSRVVQIPAPNSAVWEFLLPYILAKPWYCQTFEVLLIWNSAFPWFQVCLSIIPYVYLAILVFSFVTCGFLFFMFFYWISSCTSPYVSLVHYIFWLFVFVDILHLKNVLPVAYLFTLFMVCFVLYTCYILIESYLLVCSFMVGAFA